MTADGIEPEQQPGTLVAEIDASPLSVAELNYRLSQLDEGCKAHVSGIPSSLSGVGAGFDRSIDLQVVGSVGPFAFMLGQRAKIEITQGAGLACGHSFHSGSLLIRGDCGPHVACYALGGLVTVYGKAGDYAGYGLSGGEVVIRSRCGLAAGAAMRSGTLVLGNGTGEMLGQGMTGGVIFARGTVAGLGEGVRAVPIKDADSLRLGLLLARAGLKTQLSEFKAFRPLRPASSGGSS